MIDEAIFKTRNSSRKTLLFRSQKKACCSANHPSRTYILCVCVEPCWSPLVSHPNFKHPQLVPNWNRCFSGLSNIGGMGLVPDPGDHPEHEVGLWCILVLILWLVTTQYIDLNSINQCSNIFHGKTQV
jgi:hypothetical protein